MSQKSSNDATKKILNRLAEIEKESPSKEKKIEGLALTLLGLSIYMSKREPDVPEIM